MQYTITVTSVSPWHQLKVDHHNDLACPLQRVFLADLNQNGPSKVLMLADVGLMYKTSRDTQEAAKAPQQVNNVFTWCQDTRSPINPGKAQTQWSTLDNRAARKVMPAATVDGAVVEQTSSEIPWDPLQQSADL